MLAYCIDTFGLPHDKVNVKGCVLSLSLLELVLLHAPSLTLLHLLLSQWCHRPRPPSRLRASSLALSFRSSSLPLTRSSFLPQTGARQVATGLHEIRRRGGKILVTSMCIGLGASSLSPSASCLSLSSALLTLVPLSLVRAGMGAAAVFVAE